MLSQKLFEDVQYYIKEDEDWLDKELTGMKWYQKMVFAAKFLCGICVALVFLIYSWCAFEFFFAHYGYEETSFIYSRVLVGYFGAVIMLNNLLKRDGAFFAGQKMMTSMIDDFLFIGAALSSYISRVQKDGFTSFLVQFDVLYIACLIVVLVCLSRFIEKRRS